MKSNSKSKISTRKATDTIKGIAILSVLINHYLMSFTSLKEGGLANTVILVFFLLSGYGISISLHKKNIDTFYFNNWLSFYFNRFIRIFPLYWIALLLEMIVTARSFSFLSFFGFEAGGHYWFISAILECYIITPILVNIFNYKKSNRLIFTVITVAFVILYFGQIYYDGLGNFLHLLQLQKSPYKEIYFLNIYIYIIGFFLGKVSLHRSKTQLETEIKSWIHRSICISLFVFITFYLVADTYYIDLNLLVIVSLIIITTVYYIRNNNYNIKLISFLGRLSFPVYLFHMSYYAIFENMKFLQHSAKNSLILIVLLFPVFMAFCRLAVELEQRIVFFLKERVIKV